MSVPPFPIEAVRLFFRILATERGLRMSKQLWNYLRSIVQVVTSDGKVIKGFVTDFIDEMDNDEPTEISLLESEIISIKAIS